MSSLEIADKITKTIYGIYYLFSFLKSDFDIYHYGTKKISLDSIPDFNEILEIINNKTSMNFSFETQIVNNTFDLTIISLYKFRCVYYDNEDDRHIMVHLLKY
jgi:hypothetical protein